MASAGGLYDESDDELPLFNRRKLVDGEMDITPMIDCVFQLLIFFMVASNMQGGKTSDVPIARYGIGVETVRATVITVEAPQNVGERPRILVDGDREADLDHVRQLVADRKREGRSQVIVKAERRVPHGFVQQVTRAVTETEGIQFYIAVQDK